MTQGSLWKNMFFFSVPLIFSQILEVMFNLSDVAVVGHFADYKALGSVGSTTTLVTLFTGLLIGLGSGVNVQVANKLGAGDKKATKETIHSALIICAAAGIFVCLICLLFAGPMLSMMNTKPELLDQAVLYMKVFALGMPATAVYNFGNGVLSARGDTKRPMYYLAFAGILNVLLNLIFVIVFHMAAVGVATASAIAQYVSGGLILIHLMRRDDECKVRLRNLRYHNIYGKGVLYLGVPSGLQNAIFAIANLFVQSGVNSFDAIMVSGNAAAANADNLIYNVMFAFYVACSSFMSQNWGAGNKERMKKCYLVTLTYSFSAGLLLGGALFFFGRPFLSLFATEPAVIAAGMHRIRIMGFSYAFSAFMDCAIASSRGIGKSIAPTFIVIMGSCVFRIIWIYTVFAYFQQFHLCICCTSSPGDSQRLQKPYTLKLVSKRCLHNRFPKEKRGISQISNICKNLLFFLSTIYSALVILLSILKYQLSCSADSCIISKSSKLKFHILICKERFFHKWFFDK